MHADVAWHTYNYVHAFGEWEYVYSAVLRALDMDQYILNMSRRAAPNTDWVEYGVRSTLDILWIYSGYTLHTEYSSLDRSRVIGLGV